MAAEEALELALQENEKVRDRLDELEPNNVAAEPVPDALDDGDVVKEPAPRRKG